MAGNKSVIGNGGNNLMGVLCIGAVAVFVLAFTVMGKVSVSGSQRFMETCVTIEVPQDEVCKSKSAIQDKFKISADALIERRRMMMVSTVQRIMSGELRKADAYHACIQRGECLPVPLLPENTDIARVASGQEYLDTRKAFWQLSENSKLTPEICAFIDVCKALQATGAITFE